LPRKQSGARTASAGSDRLAAGALGGPGIVIVEVSLLHLSREGRRGSASGGATRASPAGARRAAAELMQLGLDQRGELKALRQRVRVGIAAEEELLAVADHSDRERVALGNGDDRVDLFELASQ
jgi:hypothetical protein